MITTFIGCNVRLPDNALREYVYNWMLAHIREYRVSAAIIGAHPGIDHWVGWACLVANVPYCLALDYEGLQESMSPEDRAAFDTIRARASKVEVVNDASEYNRAGMFGYARASRNRWMLRNSNKAVIAINSKRGHAVDASEFAAALDIPRTILDLNH